ncbi:hypothetical protein A1C_06455 [Rickettsia akari str. Hartford]|uniref:Phosphatidylethanolamine-binding protein PEBP n=1 Tax=Rickettsia akari (strain Hartford) TaxID=293614 RepID=A8GQ39_RICAH|nr:hypothetical protein A1C_06455 [Rickettsia akari str. Hartford]
MTFIITSTAFKHNDRIPDKFTCKGQNVSPHLEWNNAPSNTKSFALIMDDPDAPVDIAPPHGIWNHWTIYY